MHAFVDESIRAGSYRLTAVLVQPADLAMLGRAVRAAIPNGSKRTHLSAEGEARKRQILTAYCRLPLTAVVYRTDHRRTDNDGPARRRCLTALLDDLSVSGVRV